MNPELRRNLWLELSTHRLVAMPAVLFLVFVLFASRNVGDWAEIVFTTAVGLFIVIVPLWGTYKAAESVTDEVRDRTWDWQRLSALDPWRMTWGKLAGATAFTWYGAAICMVAKNHAEITPYLKGLLANDSSSKEKNSAEPHKPSQQEPVERLVRAFLTILLAMWGEQPLTDAVQLFMDKQLEDGGGRG